MIKQHSTCIDVVAVAFSDRFVPVLPVIIVKFLIYCVVLSILFQFITCDLFSLFPVSIDRKRTGDGDGGFD